MAKDSFKINKGISLKPQSTAPTSPTDGTLYYDSTLGFQGRVAGVWGAIGGGGGVASADADAAITSNYTIQSDDNGKVINVDVTGGPVNLTMPALETGFVITVKDLYGMASTNNIKILSADLMDGMSDSAVIIEGDYVAVTIVGTPDGYVRIASFNGTDISVDPPMSVGRAVFAGGFINGSTGSVAMEFVTIATLGNGNTFGNLLAGTSNFSAGMSSNTRGVIALGSVAGSPNNTLEYITIDTESNAQDFGDAAYAYRAMAGVSTSTRGILAGGDNAGGVVADLVMHYITIASTGNSTFFNNLANATTNTTGCGSPTRSLVIGGYYSGIGRDYIQYLDPVSLSAASTFGTMTPGRGYLGACSNATIAVMASGYTTAAVYSNLIQQVTIATTGVATPFGTLDEGLADVYCAASATRGLLTGGTPNFSTYRNKIRYITFAAASASADFGTLGRNSGNGAGLSNVHGGLT